MVSRPLAVIEQGVRRALVRTDDDNLSLARNAVTVRNKFSVCVNLIVLVKFATASFDHVQNEIHYVARLVFFCFNK